MNVKVETDPFVNGWFRVQFVIFIVLFCGGSFFLRPIGALILALMIVCPFIALDVFLASLRPEANWKVVASRGIFWLFITIVGSFVTGIFDAARSIS